jgi:hypothetical protein
MSNDSVVIIAAVAVGAYLLMSKNSNAAAAAAAAAAARKPVQQGAGTTSTAQYWTSLLGPLVGRAVASNAAANTSYVANMTDEEAWASADAGGWM